MRHAFRQPPMNVYDTDTTYADLQINGEFNLTELQGVINQLNAIKQAMEWETATFLLASGAGVNLHAHLLDKDQYHENKACRAICGKRCQDAGWNLYHNVAPMLSPPAHYLNPCKACMERYGKAREVTDSELVIVDEAHF